MARFLTRLFHLSRSILLSLRSRSSSQPLRPGKPSLLWQGLLAAAAWSRFPWPGATRELLRREENSLLTGRGRDKCPGTEQRPQSERRERGAPRESTGGGFGAIHEQRDKRCELDKLGMSGSSLPVSCSPCSGRSALPGVKSLLVLKDG